MSDLMTVASTIDQHYVGGSWTTSEGSTVELVDPVSERLSGILVFSSAEQVTAAVSAARSAFEWFSLTEPAEREAMLRIIAEAYRRHADALAEAIRLDIGCPRRRSAAAQVPLGLLHLEAAADALRDLAFEEHVGPHLILREPAGVAGLITPWNWPYNQIAAKVAGAIAAGCTMVLKPSELAPRSAQAFAHVMADAGVPAGVFNLVHGDGVAGEILSSHPDIDVVSFTGSVAAGVAVSRSAAETVKRVTLELGGKSANILLDDVDVDAVVREDFGELMSNSSQSCNAATRWLVPRTLLAPVLKSLKAAADAVVVGDPSDPATEVGPLVSARQYERVQQHIHDAIEDGAPVVAGGLGRAGGRERGFYARPTVLGPVSNSMTVAREEIFGPVLCVIAYDTEDEAVRIANDSPYGLGGAVSSSDPQRAVAVAKRLRTGMVSVNGAWGGVETPFGGYKQSGNGREGGAAGIYEFLEVKSIAMPTV